MIELDNKIHFNYNDIHYLIKTNYKCVTDFNPDIILAIGSGGLIPARILKTFINKPIYVISVKAYDDNQNLRNVEIIQWLSDNLENKKVLIVDEVDDTRTTLQFCIDKLQKQNKLNEYGIFVIHNKQKEKVYELQSDVFYHACSSVNDDWIVYPWDNY